MDNIIDCVFKPTHSLGGLYIGNMYSTEGKYLDENNINAIVSAINNVDTDEIKKRKIVFQYLHKFKKHHLIFNIDDLSSEDI